MDKRRLATRRPGRQARTCRDVHTAQVGGTEYLSWGVGWGHGGEESLWLWSRGLALVEGSEGQLRVLVTLKDLPSRPASIISLPSAWSVARHPLSGRNPGPIFKMGENQNKLGRQEETSGRATEVHMSCRGEIAAKRKRPAWLPTRLRQTEAG